MAEPRDVEVVVRLTVRRLRDEDKWDARIEEMETERRLLERTSQHWPTVARYVEEIAS